MEIGVGKSKIKHMTPREMDKYPGGIVYNAENLRQSDSYSTNGSGINWLEKEVNQSDKVKNFPWGDVVKVHKIDGLEDIIEYKVRLAWQGSDTSAFSTCGMHFDSLEEAIILAICFKKNNESYFHSVMKLID